MGLLWAVYAAHKHLLPKAFALVILTTTLSISANRMDRCINWKGCGLSEPVGRVYNGKPITREEVPWLVFIYVHSNTSKGNACGGSIITRNVILTAAHCLNTYPRPKKVSVWFNSTTFRGNVLQATKMVMHPRFVGNFVDKLHDIALLKLPLKLKFNSIMKPVCLPERDIHVMGKPLTVVGTGWTEAADQLSQRAMYAQVYAMKKKYCLRPSLRSSITRANWWPVQRRAPIICAKGKNTTACPGDSGGPMTLKDKNGRWTQVGVVSHGVLFECNPRYPATYTRVALYTGWIKKMLNNPSKWRKLQFNGEVGKLTIKNK